MSKKVTFGEAISLGFKKWNVMHDTASLSEYWYWYLFQSAIGFVAQFSLPFSSSLFINSSASVIGSSGMVSVVLGILALAELVLIVPSISLLVRRFKDAGVNSRLLYLWLIAPLSFFPVVMISAISGGLAGGLGGLFAVLLLTGALGLMTLIVTLRPTKTFEQGNRWAKPSQPATAAYVQAFEAPESVVTVKKQAAKPAPKKAPAKVVKADLPVLGSED